VRALPDEKLQLSSPFSFFFEVSCADWVGPPKFLFKPPVLESEDGFYWEAVDLQGPAPPEDSVFFGPDFSSSLAF
jgi:hypothetical protein